MWRKKTFEFNGPTAGDKCWVVRRRTPFSLYVPIPGNVCSIEYNEFIREAVSLSSLCARITVDVRYVEESRSRIWGFDLHEVFETQSEAQKWANELNAKT
jgi:hypothetical protein